MSIGLRQELEDICMKADRREAMRREEGSRPVPALVGVDYLRALIARYPARTLVTSRRRIAEVLRATRVTVTDEWVPTETSAAQIADALRAAGVFRDEATVKAEALREAATAAREEATNSRTNNGRCESESLADWLDDRAAAIDPARLEGAHP